MKEQQRQIAAWLRDVMDRRQISAREWATRAGLGKDTVSRAIRDDYDNITSTRTLAKLADALGEKPPGAAGGVPSAEVLTEILTVVISAVDGQNLAPDVMSAMAEALRDTLLHLADDPEAANSPTQSRALAKAATRRQRP
jgi:DNA-binding LacI/PurR family transcriptional regulator